jgi:hypothetical protein
MDNEEINEKFEDICQRLVRCPLNCQDTCGGNECDKKQGIIPRCINFQPRNLDSFKEGIIIVGMNPGKARKKEKEIYRKGLEENRLYEAHKDYMDKMVLGGKGKEHLYHKSINEILCMLNYDKKPKLWTEVVKCQSKKDSPLSIQTMRKCVHNYLINEMNLLEDWPVFTFGNQMFTTCALLFREKAVIGFPHPSPNNRTFKKSIDKLYKNKDAVIAGIKRAILNKEALNIKDILINF